MKIVKMVKCKIADIYISYWNKIEDNNILDTDIEELFLSRISAFINLSSEDKDRRAKAKKFLLKTMIQTEEEYDFPSKMKFIENISYWDSPHILVKRADENICAIAYKVNIRSDASDQTLHEISFFTITSDGKYKFTHKYNLTECYEKYCEKNEIKTSIRQVGDPVLHREAKNIQSIHDVKLNELTKQLELLKIALTNTGGVGIAANQCSEIIDPLKIILVGVDYKNPEHVVKALTRYPTTLFPQMIICINPVVIKMSDEFDDFAEGCLSVQGAFRGLVRRPKTVIVRYQDLNGAIHENKFSGSDARVMLHELDHIINGKVYLQRIIDELTKNQCEQLFNIVKSSILNNTYSIDASSFITPVVIFNRGINGHIDFDIEQVRHYLKNTRKDVLIGLLDILHQKI